MNKFDFATECYYNWEKRLRGWELFTSMVQIEPPFDYLTIPEFQSEDDGIFKLKIGRKSVDQSYPKLSPVQKVTMEPSLVALRMRFNPSEEFDQELFSAMLIEFGDYSRLTTFEIVGTSDDLSFQFVVDEANVDQFTAAFSMYLPEFDLEETSVDFPLNSSDLAIVDFGLMDEVFIPIPDATGISSIQRFVSICERIEDSESLVFQCSFQSVESGWAEEIMRTLRCQDGSPFLGSKDTLEFGKTKVGSPLFCVRMRVACRGANNWRTTEIMAQAIDSLTTFDNFGWNSLTPLSNEGLPLEDHIAALYYRTGFRPGMILSLNELERFVQIPTRLPGISKLQGSALKNQVLDEKYRSGSIALGVIDSDNPESVYIGSEDRMKHMHVLGATGVGKSTFLLSLILQDISNGEGITVIDPHGDLIDDVLARIPEERMRDVVIFDPGNYDHPPSFNVLDAFSEAERVILTSDLVSIFQAQATSWGDQMTAVLQMAIGVFLERDATGTIFELKLFLDDEDFRESILEEIHDLHLLYYWRNEFPLLRKGSISPLLTRLNGFLSSRIIRNIMVFNEGVGLRDILSSQKIFLVKLSHGLIGEQNANLLGSLLIAKLYQTAMSRQNDHTRPEHYVYIDEFHHLITESLPSFITGVRKYNVGLVLAHQNLEQLRKHGNELKASILANVFTSVSFRLGLDDATVLQKYSSNIEPEQYSSLSTGEAIIRLGSADQTFEVRTENAKEIPSTKKMEEIVEFSSTKYSHPREEAEKLISKFYSDKSSLRKEQTSFEKSNESLTSQEPEVEKEEIAKPIVESGEETKIDIQDVRQRDVEKKEERDHIILQKRVKKLAQGFGWKADVEATIGTGKVDVLLHRGTEKVGVEISVTNTVKYELQNIEKCLVNECSSVVFISSDRSKREKILELYSANADVIAIDPSEFGDWLLKTQKPSTMKIAGYRVKTSYCDRGK